MNDGIERFLIAQKNYYKIAKKELLNGKKTSHWMWFIFPQLKGLGNSEFSVYYGLDGEKETTEYFKNKKLRKRLINLLEILLKYPDDTKIEGVFGELDSKKLHSCLTLFFVCTWDSIFQDVLKKYYNGCLDNKTVILCKKR